jgi:mycothiol synthase
MSAAAPDLTWEQTRIFMRRPWLDDLPRPPALPAGATLRCYAPSDLMALAALLTRAFDETWDEGRVRSRLAGAPDVEAISVVAQGQTLMATASARLLPGEYPGSGYLHWVATDPAYQGCGLGRLVSLRMLRHFKETGLRDAVLETQDFRVTAVRTYLRLGFVPEYRYGDPHEQLRWARLLSQLVQ